MSGTQRWTIVPGDFKRLGATPDAKGVNFALFSAQAEQVELCLYDEAAKTELQRLRLPERTGDIWHGYVPALTEGYCYGYRVSGRYDPAEGFRINPNKLLLDPYAKSLAGEFRWSQAHFGYNPEDHLKDLSFSASDNADCQLKARIVSDWVPFDPANKPWRSKASERIIYELHPKGFTQQAKQLPKAVRGYLAGLGHPETLAYLKSLGVTTLELLPVHAFIDDYFLHQRHLNNYWGYNTLNFFTPHLAYLGSGDRFEFREAIERIHAAGLEVVLDVVYNHTAETDHLGPTLSYRGIDNASYYQLESDRRHYVNDTGCGNTFNFNHPKVLRLVMDSLRHWVTQYGIDGFRFDLASILGRKPEGFDPLHPLFQAIEQDPVLSHVHLIAEPWDIGMGGYQMGNFPVDWAEWNDRYRDTMRRFWRGDAGLLPEFAKRLHGSADIFEARFRKPTDSLNFITSHDGFTLHDLVTYRHRHNRANGEQNRDGHGENYSENWGTEGETAEASVNQLRLRQKKNLLLTLFVSQGTPMLLAGDELHRTQQGNNNAYCQDNEINWLNWEVFNQSETDLLDFVKRLTTLRKAHRMLGQDHYIHRPDCELARAIHWFDQNGEEMTPDAWHQPDKKTLVYFLKGDAREAESSLLILFNRGAFDQPFTLPTLPGVDGWQLLISSSPTLDSEQRVYAASDNLLIQSYSCAVFNAQA